jgi:hypothetical protein
MGGGSWYCFIGTGILRRKSVPESKRRSGEAKWDFFFLHSFPVDEQCPGYIRATRMFFSFIFPLEREMDAGHLNFSSLT